MKHFLLAAGLTLVVSMGMAQQDPQFSQNMFNRLFPNPGFAGSNNAICGTLLGRHQWMGFEGKPETYQLSLHAPVPVIYGGVGLVVYQDQLGQEKTFGLKASYAYRRQLGPGKIGVGLALGMINKNIGSSWRAIDDYTQDPSIPDAGAGKTAFDMDLGVYYEMNKLYVGISAMHLPASSISDNGGVQAVNFTYNVQRHYYIMGGYTYEIVPADIKLKPSVFIKTDGASTQLDINAIALWQDKVWGGVSYRLEDAIVPMVGYQQPFGNGIGKIGYSYDVTTSQLRTYSSGSHEIMLGYCFNLPDDDQVKKVKTVRFL
ncbi:MAG: type IX secretion system membrane protein PorP/SprF [Flavobacteriales bacterium]|nr:type IX secretion system membrane protein PorP/SprF [Flavobacteriales bacterium]